MLLGRVADALVHDSAALRAVLGAGVTAGSLELVPLSLGKGMRTPPVAAADSGGRARAAARGSTDDALASDPVGSALVQASLETYLAAHKLWAAQAVHAAVGAASALFVPERWARPVDIAATWPGAWHFDPSADSDEIAANLLYAG